MSEKEIKEHQLFISSYPVLFKLWRDNKKTINNKKMFLKIFLFTTISGPFRWVQNLLYKRRIKAVNLQKNPPVFVIGHWRSGTTYLHYLLSQDQRFSFLEAFQAFFFRTALVSRTFMKPILNRVMPKTRPQDNIEINASAPTEEEHSLTNLTHRSGMQSFFFPKNISYFNEYNLFETSSKNVDKWKQQYNHMLKEISYYNGGKKKLLLKNPHNTARIEKLQELYPKAKFIFIHRNPYEVYNSTVHLYKSIIKSQFLQDFSENEIEERVLYCYEKTMKAYLKQKQAIHPSNIVEVSYDDLSITPLVCLKSIYEQLDLGDFSKVNHKFEEYISNQKNYKKNTFTEIKENAKSQITSRWKFAFETWNYEIS